MNRIATDSGPAILIIEDQAGLRRMLEILFHKEGFQVAAAADGTTVTTLLDEFAPDIVLTDLRMEPVSGIDVLRTVRGRRAETPVILMTAFGSIAAAVEAMKLGAVDFITKPFKNEELLLKVTHVLEGRSSAATKSFQVTEQLPGVNYEIVANSTTLRAVMEQIDRIADSHLTVLITGETGTGKTMLAQEIHKRSSRSTGPFIPINAAALPEPLLESELFGYEKGAFTGANTAHAGLFEAADGGTIFLDEIGTLPANLQSKLLGVLQDRHVRRVGGHRIIPVNARFVTATNIDLEEAVRRREFRDDLYYRINVARIHMPPLREHREDIPHILKGMLERFSMGKPFRYAISPEALARLNAYPFPGNVRELRNAIEWAVAVARGSMIEAEDLPDVIKREVALEVLGAGTASSNLADVEREQISRAIENLDGNLAKVARTLGIGRTTLWRKMREYGLKK